VIFIGLLWKRGNTAGLCQEALQSACGAEDEGRSFGVVLQEKAPNSHELLQSKAVVVNVMEKAWL
jgi:hypothetical protein